MCKWVQLKNGKWVWVQFTKEETKKVYEKAYEKEIREGKVISWDIEHPVRNVTADREIGFTHPEYWKSRNYYTFAHKIDLAVYLKGKTKGKVRIDIWESDPTPITETIGQLICYKKWIEREHHDAEEVRMNYVTYNKYSEVDKIAYDLKIFTWIVVFSNEEIVKLEKYETKEW